MLTPTAVSRVFLVHLDRAALNVRYEDPVSSVQVLACNVSTQLYRSIDIFTDSFPFQTNVATILVNQSWSDWVVPKSPQDPILSNVSFCPSSRLVFVLI